MSKMHFDILSLVVFVMKTFLLASFWKHTGENNSQWLWKILLFYTKQTTVSENVKIKEKGTFQMKLCQKMQIKQAI